MTGIMNGKRGLIMGVANNHSIAWGIAQKLAGAGAELAFTDQGEALGKRVKPLAAELGSDFIIPCDVEDIASVDATIEAVYAVISGPAGEPRDFDRMRTLFTPDARLTAITAKGLVGGSLDDYIARSGKGLVESGFTERQLARRIEQYGDLAHAWSSYSGTFTNPDGTRGTIRGINSFQLVRQDGNWLVQSIFWQAEAPSRPLPADMTGDTD